MVSFTSVVRPLNSTFVFDFLLSEVVSTRSVVDFSCTDRGTGRIDLVFVAIDHLMLLLMLLMLSFAIVKLSEC